VHRAGGVKQRLHRPDTRTDTVHRRCIVGVAWIILTSRVWGRCSTEQTKLKRVEKKRVVRACDQLSPPLNRLAMSLTDIFIGSLGSPRALSQSMTTFLASSIGTERVEGVPFDALLALSASP